MQNSYTVKVVNQQEKDFKDPNPPRGGFGLAEDDIIYRTVHETLDKERQDHQNTDDTSGKD